MSESLSDMEANFEIQWINCTQNGDSGPGSYSWPDSSSLLHQYSSGRFFGAIVLMLVNLTSLSQDCCGPSSSSTGTRTDDDDDAEFYCRPHWLQHCQVLMMVDAHVKGCQAEAPTSSGLRAPTLSGQSTNMEEIFNTHDNVCQAKAPTSSGLRAPTLSGQSTNMEQIFNTHVNGFFCYQV